MSGPATLARLGSDVGELLASHDRGRDLREFEAYAQDPVAFIRDVLRWAPYPKQVEIAEAVRDHPLTVVRSCNAAGKDAAAARLALWAVYACRALVLVTGPTERQVVEVVMGELGRAWRAAPDLPGELYRTALRLGRSETAGVLAFTSTEASKLTGFHAPRVMAIITEAQGVEDFAWEGLLACATGASDRILAVGNPLRPSGTFHAVSRPGSGWQALRISASDVPGLEDDRAPIPGLLTHAGVERIRRMFGESSGVYTARVLGEFPETSEEGLFARPALDAAAERFDAGELEDAARRGRVFAALDVPRYGPDASVLLFRQGPVARETILWPGRADTSVLVSRVRSALAERGLDRDGLLAGLVVDTVGVGGGPADRLRELRYPVVEFNGGTRAEQADRFLNQRAESFWRLRERLEQGSIAVERDDELFAELLAHEWKVTADGRIQVVAKDQVRSAIGRSPDRADALAMAFAARPPRRLRVYG